MGALQPWHWLILIAVVVLLFGSKRLPDAARSLGKSMRIFKSEVKELQNEGKTDTSGHACAAADPGAVRARRGAGDTASGAEPDRRATGLNRLQSGAQAPVVRRCRAHP